MRVGTTRGTNALLENRGAPTALFTSPGFRDLLTIGDQRRPDLFALAHHRRPPLQQKTIEHHSLGQSLTEAQQLLAGGITSAAIALKGSYEDPSEERALAHALRKIGFQNVSVSSTLAPLIKLLPRAQTAVVDAYLAPILDQFVNNIKAPLDGTAPVLMTSSGGLETAARFKAKDSLLSGPAGGLTGAIAVARAAGIEHIIAFDMGGTSTDVSRSSGQPSYQFEQRIGDAVLLSPSLKIETVAAGGGSICSLKASGLSVGPESAGADPGPACYAKGGPLTLTDVNLLLGHLDEITIPLDPSASQKRLAELQAQISPPMGDRELLEGLREIANERMADAIRKISLREGYDPAEHTLVAFGGAGPQHACAVAEKLGITDILIPADAGLLSALGIHHSEAEHIAQRQVLQPLGEFQPILNELITEATTGSPELVVKRQIAEIRLTGQDTPLQIDIAGDPASAFADQFETLFGYPPPVDKQLELVSLRVIASTPAPPIETESFSTATAVADPYSTLVISDGWTSATGTRGSQLLTREAAAATELSGATAIQAELYRHRFHSIVEEMGTLLQRTAVSTNIKERADFSCALLDAEGKLVMSAPHIPVHLGALGVCVRMATAAHPLLPGDMLVTNHPAFGGSHLPDITLISPIYMGETLIGYVANRAHHAEIGGISPGSMPADAANLAEEGTVIPPTYLFRSGSADFDSIAQIFTAANYPTRNLSDNLADLRAQAAANLRAVAALESLPAEKVTAHMAEILRHSNVPKLQQLPTATAEESLDDGSIIRVAIRPGEIDFTGTSPRIHPGNLNATPAIVRSAVLYVLRLYLQIDLPLNEGILTDIKITLPECFLNPKFSQIPERCPAVVGGNVETSQRLVDTLIKALGIQACSQGTMNNFIFGDETFGYYETIAGGSGAGVDHHGTDAIHTHMTNTAITDPEILESRYPVKLVQFSIRENSGGAGIHNGGNGVVREFEFLRALTVSLLTQHRKLAPFGLNGASPGKPGRQILTRRNGEECELPPSTKIEVQAGDRLRIETPGGGGANS
ncbi:MAG: 5-oxoprolinase (ATP-hydrolyzing) [Verrucomicrobiales bacterium]